MTIVNVQDPQFGAKGDGATNDTAAITAADAYARSLNPPARVYFPSGIYMVSQLVLYTNSNWRGEGKNSTTLRQISGSNTDLLYGVNSNANWGSTQPAAFPYNITLQELTLDGNWNAGAGNTSGSGLSVFGDRFVLNNVYIKNCAQNGIRTEYIDSAVDYGEAWYESTFQGLRIDNCGQHGWLFNGPHDAHIIDVTVLDAGQSSTNTYDGFVFASDRATARCVAIHAATRSGSKRMRYSVNVQPGAIVEVTGGSNIEGAYTANLGLFSSQCIFDPSTRYYAAWQGTNIYLGGANCSLNQIQGKLMGPPSGRPTCVGVQFSTVSGDAVNNNRIDVSMDSQDSGLIVFTAQDHGYNLIRVHSYSNQGANISGTPHVLDDVEVRGSGAGADIYVNTKRQTTRLTIGPQTNGEWTYTYPFYSTPVVTFSPQTPNVALTAPLWINGINGTSVSIYNPNAATVTLNLVAEGVY